MTRAAGRSVPQMLAGGPRMPVLSEKRFQSQVEQLAALKGWVSWHDTDARRNRAGLPDLLLLRERLVFVELKSERGKLRPAQVVFLDRLRQAGQEVYVWKPSDWDTIEGVLA